MSIILALRALLRVDLLESSVPLRYSCSAVNLPECIRIQTKFLHKYMKDLVKYTLPIISSVCLFSNPIKKGGDTNQHPYCTNNTCLPSLPGPSQKR